jgi:hypothetical protein
VQSRAENFGVFACDRAAGMLPHEAESTITAQADWFVGERSYQPEYRTVYWRCLREASGFTCYEFIRNISGELKAAEGRKIEMDEELKSLFTTLIEGQIRTDRSLNELVVSVNKYVDAADARMRRIEDNLDGLIRAITSEHTNGKSH